MTRELACWTLTGALLSVGVAAEDFTFQKPRHNAHRVDACRTWGAGCGQEAADAFCRLHGYERAATFEIDPKIGAVTPTMTLGDQKLCDQQNCDGFKSITCTRAGTGRLHLPAPLRQPAPQPPANQPSNPPPAGGVTTMPPNLRGKLGTPPPTTPPPPSPSVPAADASLAPSSGSTADAIVSRLEPEEFVVLFPKGATGQLARFGKTAQFGKLEEQRAVTLDISADVVQAKAADLDVDGREELLLLETPDPSKPDYADLRVLVLTEAMAFEQVEKFSLGGDYGGMLLLEAGRFLGNGKAQALVYAIGGNVAIIPYEPPAQNEFIPVQYKAKGVLIPFDINGDGRDEVLDYAEADGSLEIVIFGDVKAKVLEATTRSVAKLGPGQRFAVGDFTGDRRPDLFVHDTKTGGISLAIFDSAGQIVSFNAIGGSWPASRMWTRGFDYDGDGRDDLLVADAAAKTWYLVRFTPAGEIKDEKPDQMNPESLLFPGYFTGTGRASFVALSRAHNNQVVHLQFDTGGNVLDSGTIINKLPDGGIVVVGNFRRDR